MGIMGVDKDASTVTFKAAFRQWWYDPRLSWNESDYGGVDRLWMSSSDKEVWIPDTMIREDAGSGYFSDFKETAIRIHSNGLHYWTRLGELKVSASLDFTKYPYDC
jgi:Neurotransmitter-gated ion-channel ligand binding domain